MLHPISVELPSEPVRSGFERPEQEEPTVDGFEVKRDGDRLVLSGELDAHTAVHLDGEIDKMSDSDRIVMDVSAVTFVDSSGLRSLITARGDARDRVVELKSPSGSLLRLLEITGLTDSFEIT